LMECVQQNWNCLGQYRAIWQKWRLWGINTKRKSHELYLIENCIFLYFFNHGKKPNMFTSCLP
jgi:hypothetical protein